MLCFQSVLYCIVLYNDVFTFLYVAVGNKLLLLLYVIFLRIIPRIWLSLKAAILHCSETFMLAFIVTPKSFSFTVLHRLVPSIS